VSFHVRHGVSSLFIVTLASPGKIKFVSVVCGEIFFFSGRGAEAPTAGIFMYESIYLTSRTRKIIDRINPAKCTMEINNSRDW